MNLFLRIVLLACMYCVLPIEYAMMRNEVKPKKNIILGTTLPQTFWQAPEVQSVCRLYQRRLRLSFLILTLAILPGIVLPYMSVSLTYYLVWLIFAMAVPAVIYAKANTALRAFKANTGLQSGLNGKVLVDLQALSVQKNTPSDWLFLPPIMLCLLPLLLPGLPQFAGIPAALPVSLTATTFFFWVVNRFLFRKKPEAIDANTALTTALTQIRRQNWNRICLWSSWLTALYTVAMYFFMDHMSGLLTATFIYMILLILVCMKLEFDTRKAQQKLSASCSGEAYVDEDQHWLWGMLYYNPNDTHLIVNNRIGINTTINLARPAGRILGLLCLLLILLMPLLGIWMIPEELAPLTLELSETSLQAIHNGVEYRIDTEEIVNLTLLEDMPVATKLVGTNYENYCKGSFQLKNIGRAKLCADPTIGPWLLIETQDGLYLLNSRIPEETISIYQQLSP